MSDAKPVSAEEVEAMAQIFDVETQTGLDWSEAAAMLRSLSRQVAVLRERLNRCIDVKDAEIARIEGEHRRIFGAEAEQIERPLRERAERAEAALAAARNVPREPTDNEIDAVAFHLCEVAGDDPHTLIYEGNPPEPWGEVWMRYRGAARSACKAMYNAAPPLDYPNIESKDTDDALRRDDDARDAARYRWLRSHGSCPFSELDDAWESPDGLDAAVDEFIAYDDAMGGK